MQDVECLSQAVRDLYAIVDRLGEECAEHERRFTLDGHLLGSIGEVYAAERYGISLHTSSGVRLQRKLGQLQNFPRGWTDTGMADGRRAFCMGNALVVGVLHLIGKAIGTIL